MSSKENKVIEIILSDTKTGERAAVEISVDTKLGDMKLKLQVDGFKFDLADLAGTTEVSVNGRPATKDTVLKQGDEVTSAPNKVKAAA